MSYGLAEHWQYLQASLQTFDDQFAQTPFESDEDKISYMTTRNMLQDMLQLGLSIEATLWPTTKMRLGKELDNLNLERFGPLELPTIKGTKSLLLAQQVFLPQLKRGQLIEYNPFIFKLGSYIGIDINEKKAKAARLAESLTQNIKAYVATHSNLKENSMFAIDQDVAMQETNVSNFMRKSR